MRTSGSMEFFPKRLDRGGEQRGSPPHIRQPRWAAQLRVPGRWKCRGRRRLHRLRRAGACRRLKVTVHAVRGDRLAAGAWTHWGRGYATEAARASLSVRVRASSGSRRSSRSPFRPNVRSRPRDGEDRHDPRDRGDDLDHSMLPEGHPIRRHVLYRLKKSQWDGRSSLTAAAAGSGDGQA